MHTGLAFCVEPVPAIVRSLPEGSFISGGSDKVTPSLLLVRPSLSLRLNVSCARAHCVMG